MTYGARPRQRPPQDRPVFINPYYHRRPGPLHQTLPQAINACENERRQNANRDLSIRQRGNTSNPTVLNRETALVLRSNYSTATNGGNVSTPMSGQQRENPSTSAHAPIVPNNSHFTLPWRRQGPETCTSGSYQREMLSANAGRSSNTTESGYMVNLFKLTVHLSFPIT